MNKGLYLAGGLLLAGLLYACGGGGGGSSSMAQPAAASLNVAAAAATHITGTVTGLASLVIDGVDYDDSAVTVAKDVGTATAQSATLSGLQIGQRVDFDAVGGVLGAGAIRPQVIGPVATINAANTSFTVLGQTVIVSATTTFGGGLTAFTGLAVAAVVEVHGTVNADGSIQATRVEAETQATPGYLVVGTVGGLAAGATAGTGSFLINGLAVTYDATTKLLPTGGPALANGQTVTVHGTVAPTTVAGTLTLAADVVRIHLPNPLIGKTIFQGGRARNLVMGTGGTLASFTVDDFTVDTTSASLVVVDNGVAGTLANVVANAHVLVLGTVSPAGTLVASEIWVITAATEALLVGPIVSVDTTTQTFVLRHTTVDYSKLAAAEIVNGTTTNIVAGAFVVVTGTLGPSSITADSLTFTTAPVSFPPANFPPGDLPGGHWGGSPANPHLPAGTQFYVGTVSNLATSSSGAVNFTLTSRKGAAIIVNELSTTAYFPSTDTAANVVNGAEVLALGVVNSGGSLDAAKIAILP